MAKSNSALYYELTGRRHVYNIMPIQNIPSVIRYGIVCYDTMSKLPHESVAMNEVQQRRDSVIIPGGHRLHSYANLYFAYDNPMLYSRKDQAEKICILAVSAKVLDIEGCVVSDQNAATGLVRFYPPALGIQSIDFNLVFARYWTHPEDFCLQILHKHVKCAEILIPESVPYKFINGAYVYNQQALELLSEYGFTRKIIVEPKEFYR